MYSSRINDNQHIATNTVIADLTKIVTGLSIALVKPANKEYSKIRKGRAESKSLSLKQHQNFSTDLKSMKLY